VGWRCSHVDKHKPRTNHILVAYWNLKGHGHGLLDFHAPTEFFNLQVLITKGLKTSFRRRRRLVSELIFEKMRIAIVVDKYKPYPTKSIYIWIDFSFSH
jgi:hypothetical protein